MANKTFKTFAEVRAKYKVEKGFHTPWHFSGSGQYVCFLSGNKECYKTEEGYIVGKRR
jgi:hypothetical protein